MTTTTIITVITRKDHSTGHEIINSAKEVMHLSVFVCLFVCLFVSRDYAKNTQPIFIKFGGKVPHVPRKKRLYCAGNPDYATLGLEL